MANGTGFVTHRKKTVGDVAVDGLLAGMTAGLVMGVLLILFGLLGGTSPLQMLGRFDPADGGSAAIGGLLHLAVSGIYGILFAIFLRFLTARWVALRRNGWLIGAGYGLALWLAAQFVFLPGLNTALTEITPLYFALAHLAYGAVLGYIMGRHQTG